MTAPTLHILAAASDPFGVVVWSLVLLVLLVGGYLAVAYIKKWHSGGGEESLPRTGFTLAELRDLHRRGQMTDVEFAAAKAKVVEAAQRATAKQAQRKAAASLRADPGLGFQQKPDARGGGADNSAEGESR